MSHKDTLYTQTNSLSLESYHKYILLRENEVSRLVEQSFSRIQLASTLLLYYIATSCFKNAF